MTYKPLCDFRRRSIVPLGPLLDTFGISELKTTSRAIVSIFSYATPSYFALLETYNSAGGWIPSGYIDTEQLVPQDVLVRRIQEQGPGTTLESLYLTLNLKQTSGKPIRQGQQGFFTLVSKGGGVTLGGRDTAIVLGPGNEDPCKKQQNGFRCRQSFSDANPDFVVALVRVRE